MKSPYARVGILGAGQLARMLSLAAYPLNITTLSISEKMEDEGNGVTPLQIGGFLNQKSLQAFCQQVDIITFETENIPVEIAQFCLDQGINVLPGIEALRISQDRLLEKNLLRSLGIATAEFYSVDSLEDLDHAAHQLGFPFVLKTRRLGYDGKGQVVVKNEESLKSAFLQLVSNETEQTANLIAEQWIAFSAEVSLIAARNSQQTVFYPLCENTHEAGILRMTQVKLETHPLQFQAQESMQKVLNYFDYKGVLTIEFFVHEGRLIANEMAPRVHNSGHWTIEGSITSQFANHLRGILDWPLGATKVKGPCTMINCIGEMPSPQEILAKEGWYYHDYGKEARPGRKVGHLTAIFADTL